MSIVAKLAGFVAALAVLFGVAAVAGGAIDPDRGSTSPAGGVHAKNEQDGHGPEKDSAMSTTTSETHGAESAKRGANAGHGADAGAHGAVKADAVRGLAVADGGLRVVVDTPELRRGAEQRLAFRIVDARGRAVRDFDVEHEKRMHLILARRDLTGFQHLHPTMAADGTWSTTVRLPEAGSYRLFADFSVEGEARTLATDLRVDGAADLLDLPAPSILAESDGGDEVQLSAAALRAGADTTLDFEIRRDGEPVELENYLGAGGHLVALREGDLAFLHVHPTGGAPEKAGGRAGDEEESDHTHDGDDAHADDSDVAFATSFPTPGRYRLFLQYKVDGRVETVAFTVEVTR